MTHPFKKKLAFITIVYWVLLVYIIVALIFWYIELNRQNDQMFSYRLTELNKDDPAYMQRYSLLEDEHKRKVSQYIGEGSFFLVLILIGAVFVFRSTRNQLRLSQQQQNFMMAVTHELKTPLAIINLNLETLLKHQLQPDKQQRLMQNTLQESSRLHVLTNNILTVSQLESSSYHPQKEIIDVSDMLQQMMHEFMQRYTSVVFHHSIEKNIYLQAEKLLLQLLISNLVDNAVKYSPQQADITVELHKNKQRILLEIKDKGAGIANDEKKKVFDKFYRSGNEQTRSTKGTGLGLYLCKQIAQKHKARIMLKDNKPTGSVFTVVFKPSV